ncbi:MAG TPA: signal peptidase II [bacterium]|jgi:signal peptidase II
MITPSSDSLLTPGETSARAKVWPWFAGVVALVTLDQVTKILVREYLQLGHPVPLIGESLVRLTYVLNPGIAFGLEIFGIRSLLIFGWLAAVILTVYLYRLARHKDALRWPVMLFLAGAIGNSIDRLLFSQVTDFVDVDMPDFIMERFAVFNVADSCVTVGIVILAIIVLFGQRKVEERPALTPAAGLSGAEEPSSWADNSSNGESTSNSQRNAQSSSQPGSLPSDDRPGTTTGAD